MTDFIFPASISSLSKTKYALSLTIPQINFLLLVIDAWA